ncbi:hypothetical protein Syun_025147 [Stephania yunnanensis]|uniref:Uncharacterized protein n=1 Tax=Stephania yunnanensis TaxID=152371 RepID=A0AAP0EWG7_9MAGN
MYYIIRLLIAIETRLLQNTSDNNTNQNQISISLSDPINNPCSRRSNQPRSSR